MFLHCLQHGAAWFVGVCTVVEAAVFREVEYFLEVACQLLRFYVERAETLYARRVYYVATIRQWQHLAERSGVGARVVCVAYLRRLQVHSRQQSVDECRFAHSAVSAQHRNLSFQQFFNLVDAHACLGRDGEALVAHSVVEVHHHLLIIQLFVGHAVGLG